MNGDGDPWAERQGAAPAAGPRSWVTPGGHTEYEGGTVYLLHFDPPLEPYPGADPRFCAGHYRGKAAEGRLDTRLAEHAAGEAGGARGAKITRAQVQRGGAWRVYTEPGGAVRERQLKQHGAARTCPEPDCQAAAAAGRERERAQLAGRRHEAGWERAAADALGKPGPDAATWQPAAELEAG